jgi:hypothetical protein
MTPRLMPPDEVPARLLALAGCLLAIAGAKIWLIAAYGSAIPFWDQWDAEWARLFRPYLAGTLGASDLAATHNEHRILLTRLAALGSLLASGRWDAVLQMLFNVAVHTAAAGLLLVALARALDLAGALLLTVFTLALFAVPLGWENTLTGFQLQFYLLILLAPVSLMLLAPSAAFSARWWLGTAVGLASYFSIAAGAFTLPAFIALALAQLTCGHRRGRAEIAGLLLHAALAALLVLDVPAIPGHAGLKAQSAAEWIAAVLALGSWPATGPAWPSVVHLAGAALLFAPALALAIAVARERPAPGDPRWLWLGLAAWTGLQILALAYGRGSGAIGAARYRDVLIVGLMVNAACVSRLLIDLRARRAIACAATAWLLVVVIGAGKIIIDQAPQLAWRRDVAAIQAENLRRFLTTGDRAALENQPQFHIPYPVAPPLIEWLSDPAIRPILPRELLGQPDSDPVKAALLKRGPLLLPLGLALVMLAAIMALRRPRPDGR